MLNDATTANAAGEFMSRLRLVAARAPRLAVICLVLLVAVPTGFVALSQGLGAIALPYNLFVVDQRLPGIFKLHMLASGGAMLLIPLVIALRRNSAWHRPLGYFTATAVVLGALTSLPVALYSHSVAMARAGFLAQGVVWLALIALGIIAVRQRRFGEPRASHAGDGRGRLGCIVGAPDDDCRDELRSALRSRLWLRLLARLARPPRRRHPLPDAVGPLAQHAAPVASEDARHRLVSRFRSSPELTAGPESELRKHKGH